MKRSAVLVFCVLICFLFCSCSTDHNKQGVFDTNKASFEMLNEYLLNYHSSCSQEEEVRFAFSFASQTGLVDKIYSGYTNEYIFLDNDIQEAFRNVKKCFTYDFSYISVTDNRISYGGEGNEMYVYVLKGDKPDYFFSSTKKSSFSTYNLGNNWYYLFLKVR